MDSDIRQNDILIISSLFKQRPFFIRGFRMTDKCKGVICNPLIMQVLHLNCEIKTYGGLRILKIKNTFNLTLKNT